MSYRSVIKLFTDAQQAEDRLDSERARASYYLPTIETALRSILERILIAPHVRSVLSMPDSGLDTMIDLQQDNNTSRLYRLVNMVPTGPLALKRALKESIAERGRRVNEAEILEGDVEEADGDAGDDEPASKGKGKQKARLGN